MTSIEDTEKNMVCSFDFTGRHIMVDWWTYVKVLEHEIEVLKSQYQDHDTGHLRTAVSVLEHRVKDLRNNKQCILRSSYSDNTSAFQADARGLIPLLRSKIQQAVQIHGLGVSTHLVVPLRTQARSGEYNYYWVACGVTPIVKKGS